MGQLQLEVLIDPELPPRVEEAVSFETGGQKRLHVYGPPTIPGIHQGGALLTFFEDLIAGAPMPLVFAMRRVTGSHAVTAAALFLDRTLVMCPATVGFVYIVDLVSRMGDSVLGHVEPSLAQFLRGLAAYFPDGLSKMEQGERLSTAIQWVRSYLLEGTLPNIGPVAPHVRVLDVGTNGFVLASTPRIGPEGWETLFRWGHLRGILLGDEDKGLRPVLAARKGRQVGYDLERLVPLLDELEQLSGALPGWVVQGNYLSSPPDGSAVLLEHLIQVFLQG